MKKTFLGLALFLGALATSHAALIQFDLRGSTVQNSLHHLNEPSVASGGTGGEIGNGIRFDDVALTLEVNVGWGSSQGFTDLTSNSSASHIHGPTAGNNGGGGFTQTAGTVFTLTRSSNLPAGGTITQTFGLTAGQVTDLFNGKWYINIHSANNTGGEIRGFLVAVPEPSTYALAAMGCAGLIALRLRRKA